MYDDNNIIANSGRASNLLHGNPCQLTPKNLSNVICTVLVNNICSLNLHTKLAYKINVSTYICVYFSVYKLKFN
jgi:hypothetical protein